MNNVVLVRGLQAGRDLDGVIQYFVRAEGRKPEISCQARLQRFALEVLHGNEGLTLVVTHVVHRADARVIQGRHRACLTAEALQRRRVWWSLGWRG
jgi:hypothetical protein